MSMADPCRGEVWLADLGTGRGREQSGQRPALVLSIDRFNAGPAELLMVVPLQRLVRLACRTIP
jgi:mRNA interferase MazF